MAEAGELKFTLKLLTPKNVGELLGLIFVIWAFLMILGIITVTIFRVMF